LRAADDPRWNEDPSPAWDEFAPDWPFHLDTPEDPSGGIEAITLKLWPNVCEHEQEDRATLDVRG
jgi:hypothetical protein